MTVKWKEFCWQMPRMFSTALIEVSVFVTYSISSLLLLNQSSIPTESLLYCLLEVNASIPRKAQLRMIYWLCQCTLWVQCHWFNMRQYLAQPKLGVLMILELEEDYHHWRNGGRGLSVEDHLIANLLMPKNLCCWSSLNTIIRPHHFWRFWNSNLVWWGTISWCIHWYKAVCSGVYHWSCLMLDKSNLPISWYCFFSATVSLLHLCAWP